MKEDCVNCKHRFKYRILYKYIYLYLKKQSNGGNILHISQIYPLIKHQSKIPKQYQMETVKELVALGFLRKLKRDNYEIITIPFKKPLYDSLNRPLW